MNILREVTRGGDAVLLLRLSTLTQRAVVDLFINPGLPGGGFENTRTLDRGQKSNACR